MQPRVLFLNRSYWPDTEATGQLLTSLCEDLSDQFDVHVLAGQPNATLTSINWTGIDQRNGVSIHRAGHTKFSKKSMLGKATNFLSFVQSCNRRVSSLPKPDIVVFETDPFLLPFVADRVQRHTSCSMIGYLQDIYPDVAIALGKVRNNWTMRRLRKSLFDIYGRCQRVVVLSRDMKELLLESGLPDRKITIIPNWADTQQIRPLNIENKFRRQFGLHDKFVVMYSGNIGLTQRLEEFVEAAAILKNDSGIQFVFVGQGARRQQLKSQVETLRLSNVLFCDYQPVEDLSHSLGAADLHLVPLTPELSRCLMPSKLYGILAAGRPLLTNAPRQSELYEITSRQGIGITVEAGSPAGIADAIRQARLDPLALVAMGERARSLAETLYARTKSVAVFSKMLSEVALESKISSHRLLPRPHRDNAAA